MGVVYLYRYDTNSGSRLGLTLPKLKISKSNKLIKGNLYPTVLSCIQLRIKLCAVISWCRLGLVVVGGLLLGLAVVMPSLLTLD